MLAPRDLPLLAVFASVARHGSFTGAAKELGVAKSVVSQQVRALEERLATRLLHRTTRRVQITDAGAEVLRSAEVVDHEMRELSARIDDEHGPPRGTVRVATTYDLSHLLVAPAAAALSARFPALSFDIVADDSPHDLVEGRFDVAVRLGSPRDTSLTAIRLLVVDEPILAAPDVALRYRDAERPAALAGAPWVRHSVLSSGLMRFSGPDGATDELVVDVRLRANAGYAVRGLLLAGGGLGVLPRYMVADDLAAGRLVVLCPGWIWKRVTLFALFPSAVHRRRGLELFVAELKSRVSKARWT